MALPSNVGFGTVKGTFMRAVADSVDADRYPDGLPIADLVIKFTADLKPNAVVRNITAVPPRTIIIDTIVATTNNEGVLVGPDGSPDILLIASDDPDLDPHGWTWNVSIKAEGFNVSFSFGLSEGAVVDLSTVIPVPANPGASLTQWQAAVASVVQARDIVLAAAADIEDAIPNGGTTGQVLTKASNGNLDTVWAAGGGGSVTAANITDATTVGRNVLKAADAAAARSAIGAGTGSSNLALGTTSTTAKAGDYQPTAANISDATTVGRSVVTATDAAAARTAIGAGTSTLALGTSSTTAAAGDAVVRLTGAQSVAGVKTFTSAPVVPDASFAIAKVSGLQAALDSAGDTYNVIASGGTYPTVPATSPNAAIKIRHFYGPTQPSVAVWSGVLDLYTVTD